MTCPLPAVDAAHTSTLLTLAEHGACRNLQPVFDLACDALGEAYANTGRYLTRRDHHPDVMNAKRVCKGCDLRHDCLEWAFDVDDRWSVLGATTPHERDRMRRRR